MEKDPQSGRIKIRFLDPTPGIPGETITVTQEDWDRHGRRDYTPDGSMAEQRKLAKQGHRLR
jgi:hypothetical protein